jgi:hypothetical protein
VAPPSAEGAFSAILGRKPTTVNGPSCPFAFLLPFFFVKGEEKAKNTWFIQGFLGSE